MPIGKQYRIETPTRVLIFEGDRQVAHTIPAGSIITVEREPFNGNKLVDVTWGSKNVMMFLQDLRSRAGRIREASTT